MVSARKLATLAALTLIIAAPATAGAAKPTGSTNLTVMAGKATAMKNRGIELRGVGGIDTTGRKSRLQIVDGEIREMEATLLHRGALRLVAGEGRERRKVLLRGIQIELGETSSVTAKLGKKRRVILALRGGRLDVNNVAKTASLLGARAVWRRGPLRTIRKKLRAKVPAGALGSVQIRAAVLLEQPYSEAVSEPPLLARPAGAVDVAGAGLTWHVRDSWMRYISSKLVEAIDGATALPKYPGESHPCPDNPTKGTELAYSYDLPFADGWYDAASGTAALYYRGGIHFAYPGHSIDLTLHSPEIEINGAASRAIFRVNGSGATAYPDARAAVMTLPATTPVESPPGSFAFPDPLKATLTPDGQKVFANFYTGANAGFGCFSVLFSTS